MNPLSKNFGDFPSYPFEPSFKTASSLHAGELKLQIESSNVNDDPFFLSLATLLSYSI